MRMARLTQTRVEAAGFAVVAATDVTDEARGAVADGVRAGVAEACALQERAEAAARHAPAARARRTSGVVTETFGLSTGTLAGESGVLS